MITSPEEDGGAGITPKRGEWENVEAVFPLQNHAKNKQWLNEWSRKTFLTAEDFDHIRDAVGEKVRILLFLTPCWPPDHSRSLIITLSCNLTSPS